MNGKLRVWAEFPPRRLRRCWRDRMANATALNAKVLRLWRERCQKIEIARGRKLQIAQLATMDGNHVDKPERENWQIDRHNFLHLAAQRLAFFLVHFHLYCRG